MTIYRVFEIFFFELIDLIPNIILTLTAFRDSLTLSKLKIGLVTFIIYVTLSVSRILAMKDLTLATFLSTIWIFVYLFFYRLTIQAKPTKLLFILLIILNYGSFTAIVSTHISLYRIPENMIRPYSLWVSFIYIIILIFTYPIVYLLIDRKIRPLMNNSKNNSIWRFLWLVPATFCLSYYYNLYANGGLQIFSSDLKNVLFAIAFNLGTLFVVYLTIRLLEESNAYLQLKAENYQLSLQSLQYENLKNRMEESRRARHDLRQILTVIQSYLADNNTKGLQNYLSQYIDTLPSVPCILYCEDYVLNALLVYYEEMARKQEIKFEAEIQYTPEKQLAAADIVVLFGNLLENAIQACIRQENIESFVNICVKTIKEGIIITVDNSYNGQIYKYGDTFLSSKVHHTGMGITSIQKIAEKYHGVAKFEYNEKIFCASVLLYPSN